MVGWEAALPDTQIPAVVAPDPAAARAARRVGWIDNLRVTVIAGVIVLHAATAYLLDIDWYYQERTTSTLTPTMVAFPALLAGLFGLGPLFLLGGLLSATSLARKGLGGFARGRLVRLGVPLLAFLVLIDPLTDYLGSVAEGERPRLWAYLADQTGTRDTGPLWFVALLLVVSLAYAAVRRLHPAPVSAATAVDHRYLIAVAAAIAVGSFVVRLASPLGEDTFANLRWEAWPQGIGLFTLGVLAGERRWLEGLNRRLVRGCRWTAAVGALALMGLAAWALAADRLDAMAGGWTWPAAAFAVLEGSVAVALSLWVVAWFRRRWDRQGTTPPACRPGLLWRLCVASAGAGSAVAAGSSAGGGPRGQVRAGGYERCGGDVRRRGRPDPPAGGGARHLKEGRSTSVLRGSVTCPKTTRHPAALKELTLDEVGGAAVSVLSWRTPRHLQVTIDVVAAPNPTDRRIRSAARCRQRRTAQDQRVEGHCCAATTGHSVESKRQRTGRSSR
jgi:hypothetical protein